MVRYVRIDDRPHIEILPDLGDLVVADLAAEEDGHVDLCARRRPVG